MLAPQRPIVSVDHTLGFESASKSAISFSKSQAVSKRTASPRAIWNGTGFSVDMLAGNIVKESRVRFNNGLPCEPHQNHIYVFNRLCVAKLALQESIVCLYIRKAFVTYIKTVPLFFPKKPRTFNDNFLGCVAQRHIETLKLLIADIEFQGMILRQSHRHLSEHCVPYHTGFSFQIHIKVTDLCFSKKIFHCGEFWISYDLNEKHCNRWVDIWTRSKTAQCLALPIKSEVEPWYPLCELYYRVILAILESKMFVFTSIWTRSHVKGSVCVFKLVKFSVFHWHTSQNALQDHYANIEQE